MATEQEFKVNDRVRRGDRIGIIKYVNNHYHDKNKKVFYSIKWNGDDYIIGGFSGKGLIKMEENNMYETHSRIMVDKLKERFVVAMQAKSNWGNEKEINELWIKIVKESESRPYFNIARIMDSISVLKKSEFFIMSDELTIALCLENVIFNENKKYLKNLQDNAEYAATKLSISFGVKETICEHIKRLILFDREYFLPRKGTLFENLDFSMMCDLRMARFAIPYVKYRKNITFLKKEFSDWSFKKFYSVQKSICEYFLQKDKLFNIDFIRLSLEESARNNMKMFIEHEN